MAEGDIEGKEVLGRWSSGLVPPLPLTSGCLPQEHLNLLFQILVFLSY